MTITPGSLAASLSAALKKSFHFTLHVLRVRDTRRVFAGDVLQIQWSFSKLTSFLNIERPNGESLKL